MLRCSGRWRRGAADAALLTMLGACPTANGNGFAVWSGQATRVSVALFDGEREVALVPLEPGQDGVHRGFVAGIGAGTRYGYRAEGPWDPGAGHWFDPAKLLMDPYALEIDRPYRHDARLAERGFDTAGLMPKAVVVALAEPLAKEPPRFRAGGLIYELSVRGFSMLHPDVPQHLRGTLAALAHPAVIAHLLKLRVAAVELMPVVAWIDERHLPPLGLVNAWGYNPVTFMALDPRLAPGGMAELRGAVAALHRAGIGVILDLVFNHSGESDALGPTLSLRGLGATDHYRHHEGRLVNDTGCGNTLACDAPVVRRMVLDALRHFVMQAGVDGFRFDLAPILGRSASGFDAGAELLREIVADPWLSDRVLIAEPWDLGPGGYQLGQFGALWLEWNDRYRDDVRRFWRGDRGAIGALATRLAGSSDLFGGEGTRTVNFLAAHDGFSLADLVSHARKHNEANGEDNRDGHDENMSWNNGVEGESLEPAVVTARERDVRALLSTLFASRGTIMLTAGDEFGRTQRGNNNGYAQDNVLTWLDWDERDQALEDFVAGLSDWREGQGAFAGTGFLGPSDVQWLTPGGVPFQEADWHGGCEDALLMLLHPEGTTAVGVCFNRGREAVEFVLPGGARETVAARSVVFVGVSE